MHAPADDTTQASADLGVAPCLHHFAYHGGLGLQCARPCGRQRFMFGLWRWRGLKRWGAQAYSLRHRQRRTSSAASTDGCGNPSGEPPHSLRKLIAPFPCPLPGPCDSSSVPVGLPRLKKISSVLFLSPLWVGMFWLRDGSLLVMMRSTYAVLRQTPSSPFFLALSWPIGCSVGVSPSMHLLSECTLGGGPVSSWPLMEGRFLNCWMSSSATF